MDHNELRIITGDTVLSLVKNNEKAVVSVIENAYRAHHKQQSTLPHSVFLRFPHDTKNRIIGLPGYVGGSQPTAGIKWIASFPDNINHGKDRASAVIVLNAMEDGRPYAFLEASIISAKRTAASAALASKHLSRGQTVTAISCIGTGLINFETVRFVQALHPTLQTVFVYDLRSDRAEQFAHKIQETTGLSAVRCETAAEAFRAANLISIATTAPTPHLTDETLFRPNMVVLHTSLRDIHPDVLLRCINIVDDLDHVNREQTSIHLAAEREGNTDFVLGTIGQVLSNELDIPARQPIIFSPFGLGILDMALARYVFEAAQSKALGQVVTNFLPQTWTARV